MADPTKTDGSKKVVAPFSIATRQTRDRYLKFLVYAPPGVGKTHLVGTAVDCEQMSDVLVVAAESGDLTYEHSPYIKNWEKLVDNTIYATNFMQIAKIQEFLKAYCSARDRGDKEMMKRLYKMVTVSDEHPEGIETDNPPVYRTVILDSLTEIEAYCQYQVLNVEPDKVLANESGDMDTAGWPEFRKQYEMIKLLVRAYRDLPMHVLITAQSQYSKDENSRFHYSPKMTGKLSQEVQGFVDVVGYLTVGQISTPTDIAPRRMFVQPIAGGARFDAKNRRPVFQNAFMDNPTMASMLRDFKMLEPTKPAA